MSGPEIPARLLPAGVTVRRVETATGLSMRLLEAGAGADRPLSLLLHGFPELAFSWRKVIPPLAEAGFHVVAPDLRGYGGTVETAPAPDAVTMPGLVRDVVALLAALGRGRAEALVGHDFGAILSAWSAVIRPDLWDRVAIMSAPFGGPPGFGPDPMAGMAEALARLDPPRAHYQLYFSTPDAARHMDGDPAAVARFLRAYVHMKSGDWAPNRPRRLPGFTAEAMAEMPTYYVMEAGRTMPETVAPHHPEAEAPWLTDAELAVYAAAFAATGFARSLEWYRASTDPGVRAGLRLWAGARIEAPLLFLAGAADWGTWQKPGEFERMQTPAVAPRFAGAHLIPGAGHWVQQEAAAEVAARLLAFLRPS